MEVERAAALREAIITISSTSNWLKSHCKVLTGLEIVD